MVKAKNRCEHENWKVWHQESTNRLCFREELEDDSPITAYARCDDSGWDDAKAWQELFEKVHAKRSEAIDWKPYCHCLQEVTYFKSITDN